MYMYIIQYVLLLLINIYEILYYTNKNDTFMNTITNTYIHARDYVITYYVYYSILLLMQL